MNLYGHVIYPLESVILWSLYSRSYNVQMPKYLLSRSAMAIEGIYFFGQVQGKHRFVLLSSKCFLILFLFLFLMLLMVGIMHILFLDGILSFL